jgi:hypothetical protein
MTIEEDSDFFEDRSFEYEEEDYETLCPEDGALFNEEFVVYNVASTRKLNKIVEENENLGWCLSKQTNKKEVYLLRFRGTWNDLARTLKTLCEAGLTFYRNMNFYEKNKTRLLIMDIDGKEGCKQGIDFMAADQLIVAGYRPGVLVIPSSRCDYDPIWSNPNSVKKYHVFVYTDVYNCSDAKEIAELSDRFITTINGDDIATAKERFEWDKAAMKKWQYFFSKSNLSFEQIDADPNLNIRFHNEEATIFEYRNFTELFSKDFVTLDKCDKYVPNAKNVTCKCRKHYCVPAIGATAEIEEEEKPEHRDFWKELRDFAGIKESGIYTLPHYAVGRLYRIGTGQRNAMATKIMFGICFNIYAVERYAKTKIADAEKLAIDWFNDIFTRINVDDYEEFMNEFNPLVEYRRISEDTERMAMKYDYPDDVDDSKFRKTTRVGYDVSYKVNECSSRDELKQIGMSRTTEWRKAKELGLPNKKRASKLDQYSDCSEDELKELVKKGVITRVQKSRIISRRKTDDCV